MKTKAIITIVIVAIFSSFVAVSSAQNNKFGAGMSYSFYSLNINGGVNLTSKLSFQGVGTVYGVLKTYEVKGIYFLQDKENPWCKDFPSFRTFLYTSVGAYNYPSVGDWNNPKHTETISGMCIGTGLSYDFQNFQPYIEFGFRVLDFNKVGGEYALSRLLIPKLGVMYKF